MEIVDRILLWGTAVVFLAGLALVAKCWAGHLWALLNRKRKARLQNHYLNFMLWMLFSGGDCEKCPRPRRAYERRIAMENIADVARTTSGLYLDPMSPMIEDRGCIEFLMRRIRFNRGYRRAYYMQLLSRLPVGEGTRQRVKRYIADRNRYVAFYALCVQLSRDPQEHLHEVTAHPNRLSYFEQMEILLRLQYETAPINYKPMLTSGDSGLQALGIAVVWHFGIEEAKDDLLEIVHAGRENLSLEALYVLCAMNLPVASEEVAALLLRTSSWKRRSLLRFMARQGYSAMALREFVPEEDNRYYVSQVGSYKLRGCFEFVILGLFVSMSAIFPPGSLAAETPAPHSPREKITRPEPKIPSSAKFKQPLSVGV